MAREKTSIRREGEFWVCRPPGYGFDSGRAYYFRSWRTAVTWATSPLGTPGSADLQLSGQIHDAIGSVPMWTPYSYPGDLGHGRGLRDGEVGRDAQDKYLRV